MKILANSIANSNPFPSLLWLCCLQLSIYLGKRDFVDHVETVDAVGEWGCAHCAGGCGGSEQLGGLVPVPVAAVSASCWSRGSKDSSGEQTSCFSANTLKENGGEMDEVPLQINLAVLLVEMLEEALLLP